MNHEAEDRRLANVLLSRSWRSVWREYRLDAYAAAVFVVAVALIVTVCKLIAG